MQTSAKKKIIKEILLFITPLVICFILVRYVFLVAFVTSSSMEPTLPDGSMVLYNRLAYCNKQVQRGDIVIFWAPEFNMYVGKRIIGLPGDTISFDDGSVVVNGETLNESLYITKDVKTICDKLFVVPEDCYFMLGDNRENSIDSRFWKQPYINMENIKGKYIFKIKF